VFFFSQYSENYKLMFTIVIIYVLAPMHYFKIKYNKFVFYRRTFTDRVKIYDLEGHEWIINLATIVGLVIFSVMWFFF